MDTYESYKECHVCSDKVRAETVKNALELIKSSTVEELLDYSARNGYINGSFISDGREFNFYINSLNGNYEYSLTSRQYPFPIGVTTSSKEEGNMYDRADRYTVDGILDEFNNSIGEYDNIGYYSDDDEGDPDDLENPKNRARVLTEIIESEYGKGGVDKIIEYGMKNDSNIAGIFEANGQKFDFNIDISRNQLTYSPIITPEQRERLARNKDSIDRYVLGENVAKAEILGIRIDGKDPVDVNPYKVMGYLMEKEPAPFF